MLRLLVTFFVILTLALVGVWLAELDGLVTLTLSGYEIELPLLTAVIGLTLAILFVLIVWKLVAGIVEAPARARRAMRMRRRRKARETLVTGLIAAEAGETNRALALAARADRLSQDKSLVRLLEARAALGAGNKRHAAEIYKEMLSAPRLRLLGLKGLYDLALEEGRFAEAEELAHQGREVSTDAGWAIDGVLASQVQAENWAEALKTVQAMADGRFIERAHARRLRAVLLTARALDAGEDVDVAYTAAKEAHTLAPDLPPAALRVAELAFAKGDERKARKTLEAAYKALPHPDLASTYLSLGHGASLQERYKKAKKLAALAPDHRESHLLIAAAAIEAGAFEEARARLMQVLQSAPTTRAFELMADLEETEHGNTGAARQWLARALHAPRDAAWVADGLVSAEWGPVGPVSGKLDAYEWKVPVTSLAAQPALSAEDFLAIAQSHPSAHITEEKIAEVAPAQETETEAVPEAVVTGGEEIEIDTPQSPKPEKVEATPKVDAKEPEIIPAEPLPRQPDDPGLAEEDEETVAPVPDVPRAR